jgi:two-component system OmpR family response regulator
MRILIVEDSESLCRSLRRALEHALHTVDTESNGEDGLAATQVHNYDLILLDVMMPKMDGLELLGWLRKAGKSIPVLLLTARDTVEDRVRGLREGADDYLVKPFALEELLARIDALGRRPHELKVPAIEVGPLRLNLSTRAISLEGVPLEITAREWKLLECLTRKLGQVVPRAEIEEYIYDDKVEPMSNVVDTAIYGLRRKIGKHLIQTRRGLGYVLVSSVP